MPSNSEKSLNKFNAANKPVSKKNRHHILYLVAESFSNLFHVSLSFKKADCAQSLTR